MKNRVLTIFNDELNRNKIHQDIEKKLSLKLGIPSLRGGKIIIRNKEKFRVNEKEIDYSWLINVSQSFLGWYWLFSLKFNETSFRENHNPEKLIQGIFMVDENGEIINLYREEKTNNIIDNIKELKLYDLFETNQGLTIDGVYYEYLIFNKNSEIKMSLNNPKSPNWKQWENNVLELGKKLSLNSENKELLTFFK
ncbi:MAG: hypothetical protein AB8B78_02055 [Polaribacter sp.]